jgi:beta-phosphoglucomutase family hydrolase
MPEAKLEAVLWDMDGVIADTGIYHCLAWQDAFRRRGASFTDEDFRRHFGQRNDTIIRSALGDGIALEEMEAIAAEKEANYRRRIDGKIRALPGVTALMKALKKNGVKSAVASSAPPENIRLILKALRIEDCFQAIVWGYEVSEGKPSPQVFLLAAGKLGVAPPNCAVIEDAVAGVEGAKRGGMKCVAVTTSHPRERLGEADLVVDSLEAVSVGVLAGLFNNTEPPGVYKKTGA